MGPALFGRPRLTKTQRLEVEDEAAKTIKKFEDVLTHKFAAGDQFSIADIPLFFNLTMFVVLLDFKLLPNFPKVSEWHKNCRSANEVLKRNYDSYVELVSGFQQKLGGIQDAPEQEPPKEVQEMAQ